MRPSRSRRLYFLLSGFVAVAAGVLALRGWSIGDLTGESFERGRVEFGTLRAILNIVFPYLSQAAAIVGFVMTAARIWQFAEARLPYRLNDLVERWQIVSDGERRKQLQHIEETWQAIPAGDVLPARKLRSKLDVEARSSIGDINLEVQNLGQMKLALSQKSFEHVTRHYVRALNYSRLAKVLDDPKGLRDDAIREFDKALEHHRDVKPERKEIAIYRDHAAVLADANDSAARLAILKEWLSVAQESGRPREGCEAQIKISEVQLAMSNVDGVTVGRRDALRVEAQYELEKALEYLIAQAMQRDALRAKANDVLGDIKHARGLQTDVAAWQAALTDYRICGDADSVYNVTKKIERAGQIPNGVDGVTSPAALLITALIEVCDCKREMGSGTDAWTTIEAAKSRLNIFVGGGLVSAAEADNLRLSVKAAMNRLGN